MEQQLTQLYTKSTNYNQYATNILYNNRFNFSFYPRKNYKPVKSATKRKCFIVRVPIINGVETWDKVHFNKPRKYILVR